MQVYTAPLEFKSGRPHQSHRAQVQSGSRGYSQQINEPTLAALCWLLTAMPPHESFAGKHKPVQYH